MSGYLVFCNSRARATDNVMVHSTDDRADAVRESERIAHADGVSCWVEEEVWQHVDANYIVVHRTYKTHRPLQEIA